MEIAVLVSEMSHAQMAFMLGYMASKNPEEFLKAIESWKENQ